MRGGEKCLELLCRRWPHAPLFTLLHARGSVRPVIEQRPLSTSFLQRLPRVQQYYRYLLPLMPAAAAGWRLPPCELVFSLSHCVAKAVRPPRGVPHVCYCFTPMRYLWHQRHAYFGQERLGRAKAALISRCLAPLRRWDQESSERVTHFLAISRTVQSRIRECYGRSSQVIYPPVDTDFYTPAARPRGSHYLLVSAFAPYKRLDLAIAACNRLGRSLVVIGTGQDERRLRALAGPTVQFLGWQPDEVIREQLQSCRALLFPGEEDFGLVPVEAQACGAPVIALGRGGATETVIPLPTRGTSQRSSAEPTGIWFEDPVEESLIAGIQTFEANASMFRPQAARKNALRFNAHRFMQEIQAYLEQILYPARPARRAG